MKKIFVIVEAYLEDGAIRAYTTRERAEKDLELLKRSGDRIYSIVEVLLCEEGEVK